MDIRSFFGKVPPPAIPVVETKDAAIAKRKIDADESLSTKDATIIKRKSDAGDSCETMVQVKQQAESRGMTVPELEADFALEIALQISILPVAQSISHDNKQSKGIGHVIRPLLNPSVQEFVTFLNKLYDQEQLRGAGKIGGAFARLSKARMTSAQYPKEWFDTDSGHKYR